MWNLATTDFECGICERGDFDESRMADFTTEDLGTGNLFSKGGLGAGDLGRMDLRRSGFTSIKNKSY